MIFSISAPGAYHPVVCKPPAAAPDGILSGEVVSSPAFAGLTEAHALPPVKTAILSLLVVKKIKHPETMRAGHNGCARLELACL